MAPLFFGLGSFTYADGSTGQFANTAVEYMEITQDVVEASVSETEVEKCIYTYS